MYTCVDFLSFVHRYFLAHIFKLEQSAYEEEGIDWHSIVFTDNQRTLDLLSEAPGNIFALIDDESKVFGERSDNQLLEKLRETCSDHPDFLKSQQPGDREFGIQHFAGQVYYHVGGFLEKNREAFSGSILNALAECSNQFVVNLFADDLAQGKMTRKRAPTVSMQFKTSLKGLIRRLHLCQPFFIRCIKPNEEKLPHRLDHTCVLRQLRYVLALTLNDPAPMPYSTVVVFHPDPCLEDAFQLGTLR
jgi:myosin-7